MISLQETLTPKVILCVKELFGVEIQKVEFQQTRKEFEGDITLVVFSLLKYIKASPEQIGQRLGERLTQEVPFIEGFNLVKGFLNLVVSNQFYLSFLKDALSDPCFGSVATTSSSPTVIVEFSSPNTNKPLHLGHIRNNLLGYSVSKIIEASGKRVIKTQIINDRGIHICKSMVAWLKFADGKTPNDTGVKGDRFVGDYYVLFDKEYKKQISSLVEQGMGKEQAEKEAPIYLEAQSMLRKWESGDPETIALWKTMNSWVYNGFEQTYKNLGISFDSVYYESQTYLLGKDIVEQGLEKGIFFKKEDSSIWCDLSSDGLDEKLVLRGDGTSVYITQDLGTAFLRCQKHYKGVEGMVYTVGNEQDYHFKVLFLILKKLGYSWAENLYHLSYGMVELPNGKMKSREGTVVDADDLISEVIGIAKEVSQQLGKLEGYSSEQKQALYRTIGLGALKYFILKYDPKKTIKFNPEESIDFQGNTAPFIQYAYARIRSILRKAQDCDKVVSFSSNIVLHEKEKELLKNLYFFPETLQLAAQTYSPAIIATYTYNLVKDFNSLYQNLPILAEENPEIRNLRVCLSKKVSEVISYCFSLLGIDVPERM